MSLEQVLKDAVAPLARALDVSPLESQVARLSQQIGQIQTLGQAVSSAAATNTQNVVSQVVRAANPAASGIGGSLLGGLGIATGISPLIHGIFSLFGGGGNDSQLPTFTSFTLPQSVNIDAGVGAVAPGSLFAVDHGQRSAPRALQQVQAPQVTVQVQALDSQSILDRSNDIALAVRQAMLESSILNDVIREA